MACVVKRACDDAAFMDSGRLVGPTNIMDGSAVGRQCGDLLHSHSVSLILVQTTQIHAYTAQTGAGDIVKGRSRHTVAITVSVACAKSQECANGAAAQQQPNGATTVGRQPNAKKDYDAKLVLRTSRNFTSHSDTSLIV